MRAPKDRSGTTICRALNFSLRSCQNELILLGSVNLSKFSFSPKLLLVPVLVGLAIIAFGAYQEINAIQRYNDMAAIPVDALVATANQNPEDANTLAMVTAQKRNATNDRSQAFIIIGVGVVIIGLAAFVYINLPPKRAETAKE